VFQGFNLLARTSAQENTELPLLYRGESAAVRRAAASKALDSVGLGRPQGPLRPRSSRADSSSASQLRAPSSPSLPCCSPTSRRATSTPQRSAEIMDLLVALNVDLGITVLMVTHEPDMAAYAKRLVHFVDGRIESDKPNDLPIRRPAPGAPSSGN
jgi:putative ABC transport system ATP-binding protein